MIGYWPVILNWITVKVKKDHSKHIHISFKQVLKEVDLFPDSKGHGAHMGPMWGRQDPVGPHVGLMNFAIWVSYRFDNRVDDVPLSGAVTAIIRFKWWFWSKITRYTTHTIVSWRNTSKLCPTTAWTGNRSAISKQCYTPMSIFLYFIINLFAIPSSDMLPNGQYVINNVDANLGI